jgi:hypothetical protein
MTSEYGFEVEDNVPYEPKKYKRGIQKRTFDIEKIRSGSSIFVTSRAERARITSSFHYYYTKYPELYGHITVRSVPEVNQETGKINYRVFFLDKNTLKADVAQTSNAPLSI